MRRHINKIAAIAFLAFVALWGTLIVLGVAYHDLLPRAHGDFTGATNAAEPIRLPTLMRYHGLPGASESE